MNLIEQLRARKVAIDKGGEFEDVKRVLEYAFPEDRGNLLNYWRNDMYYLAMDVNGKYYYHYCTLPEGMKAIDVKEFIKEMDKGYNKELPFNYEGFGKGELYDMFESEKERADKAETKLKELQPFERGEEGWYKRGEGHNWGKTKRKYILKHKGVHYVEPITSTNPFIPCYDFTTENPHKKETVIDAYYLDGYWYSNGSELNEHLSVDRIESCIHVGDNTYSVMYDSRKSFTLYHIKFTQIGDDLQAKFDDPNNDKYKSLIK